MTLLLQEDMKSMPRVGTFLKGVLSYHTTHPTEKDVERSKKQAKVRNTKKKKPFLRVTVSVVSCIFQSARVNLHHRNKRSVVEAFIDIR